MKIDTDNGNDESDIKKDDVEEIGDVDMQKKKGGGIFGASKKSDVLKYFLIAIPIVILIALLIPINPTTKIYVSTGIDGEIQDAWIRNIHEPYLFTILEGENSTGFYTLHVKIEEIKEEGTKIEVSETVRLEKVVGENTFEWENKPKDGTFMLYLTTYKGDREISSIKISFEIENGEIRAFKEEE